MTLDLGKCALCEKAIVYEVGRKTLCPECGAKLDALYSKARTLLRDYADRRMSVSDVAVILKADERDVNYLVEEGRLERVEGWQPVEDKDIGFGKIFDSKAQRAAPAQKAHGKVQKKAPR